MEPALSLAAEVDSYDRLYRNGLYWLFWHSRKPEPELLEAHRTGAIHGKRALEIGCGGATHSLWLASHGYAVTAADFAPSALKLAQRKARARKLTLDFRLLDVTQPSDLGAPFDLIFDRECLQDLETREAREAYARNVTGWLAPGGMLLVVSHVATAGAPPPRRPHLPEAEIPSLFEHLTLESVSDLHVGAVLLWMKTVVPAERHRLERFPYKQLVSFKSVRRAYRFRKP